MLISLSILSWVLSNFIIPVAIAFVTIKGVDPFVNQFYDFVRTDQGIFGNIYKVYSRTIGSLLFIKKRKIHISLFKEGYEYRIYQIDKKVKCFESRMIRLDQNIFDRIEGEMLRTGINEKNYSTYFKGYIRKNDNYLIWEERFKNGDFFHDLTTFYSLPQKAGTFIIGVSTEYSDEHDEIMTSLSILTSKEGGYSTVKEILEIKETQAYIKKLNIDVDCIDYECNQIITLKNYAEK